MRILVVEDEVALNDVIAKRLKRANYSIDSCYDGLEAEDYINNTEYDAILLDIMLPSKNGLDILKDLRAQNIDTPVLLLTAKDRVEDRVLGLNLGADDYLVKPFSFDELLARIKSITRRSLNHHTNIYKIADLIVDCDRHIVTRNNIQIDLSSKELSILRYMIINKGIVLSRDKIEKHIWNYDYAGSSNMIDVYIRYLRKKIDEPFTPKLIHTVRGVGYVLKEVQST